MKVGRAMSNYDFSLTTFSPSGKLVQIEYALHAMSSGGTAIGIKGLAFIVFIPYAYLARAFTYSERRRRLGH